MIITHTNPDFDAICGVWLLKRYGGLTDEPVEFINTGNPDAEKLTTATAVVDTGGVFHPMTGRFDHHHLIGSAALETCAAKQVFEAVNYASNGGYAFQDNTAEPPPLEYLRPLVELILAGDTGQSEANASRELGLHALLSGYKAGFAERGEIASDQAVLDYGFGLLDTLDRRLKRQFEADLELDKKIVYRSKDGLVWAIRHGSSGTTYAAHERGARLVLFEGEPLEVEDGITYPIGIMRPGEWQEPHVGDLAARVAIDYEQFAAEIGRWFLHPAGFFAGRGTAKAPVMVPVDISLVALANAIDVTWPR